MAERFGVVVAVGLTFFGLMLIAAQDIGIQIGGSGPPERVVLESADFGEVGGATTDVRTTNFGTFSIGEGMGEIRAYRNDKVDVSNAFLSGDSIMFDYNATQPTEAAVSFEVLGKEGQGELYVEVNGQRVFQEPLVTTATETINISSEVLEPGINSFRIGTTKEGFLSSTTYALEDFEATVTDRKFNDHVDSFQMYEYELEDFVGANLTFNIPADTSVITEPLEIRVNENTVFEARSVRSEKSISIPRREAELHPGYNTISFETEADAEYTLENTQLAVRYIGTTSSADREISFDINSSNRNYLNRENTREYITFDYQILAGENNLRITVNDFNETTLSPENGENTLDIPEGILSRSNTVEIEGDGSFILDDFRVISEEVDEE